MSEKNIFISKSQVAEMNQVHGWFQYGDAQSDVSNAFANEAIERYERIRSAAPEMLAALRGAVCALAFAAERDPSFQAQYEQVSAAIEKAVGIV